MDSRQNRQILKIKEQIVSNFTQENWEEIGLLTNTIDIIKGHDRLLRSLSWGDEDYAGNVLSILINIAQDDEALNTIEFLKDQIKEIRQANEIVWIQTMAFEPGHFSDLLVHALLNASKRGVDVRFVSDAYSDYVAANSFNHLKWLLSPKNRQYQDFILQRKETLLEKLGDQFAVNKTNIPNSLLSLTPFPGFLGRDHKKISIIDNVVYLGGSNLTPLDAKRADVMVKTNNASIIEGAKRIF